jgi:hypothetical protein
MNLGLAGHSFPRSLHSQWTDPWICRCGLTLSADEITAHHRAGWAGVPPCPMLGTVNTIEQMSASLNPPAPPVVLEGQLSLLDDLVA